jgi:hypothetical protein
LFSCSASLAAQENIITLGGGYSWANIENTDVSATGFRINGVYEYNQPGASVAHGVTFSYLTVSSTEGDLKSKVTSFPIYYSPKIMFGKADKFKVFLKGALGMQFSWLEREGIVSLNDNDMGFYLGGGAGFMFFLKDNIFINAEYELAWISNSWYRDGLINSATAGIGFRF